MKNIKKTNIFKNENETLQKRIDVIQPLGSEFDFQYRVSQKKTFNCLLLSKLKTTVFTTSVFIFSKSSHLNLNFDLKQSQNWLKVRQAMATES